MSTVCRRTARSILALAVAGALVGPALGVSPDGPPLDPFRTPGGTPQASCAAHGPEAPGGGEEAIPSGSVLPEGECFEVLHGDWVCVEHWVFGCLQAHCVYPGTECSLYVPIPCPGEGSGGGGNQKKLQPSL